MITKITFISNFLNTHQIVFCDTLFSVLGTDFCFISSFAPSEERTQTGYVIRNRPYLLEIDGDPSNNKKAKVFVNESDVIIFGSGDYSLLHDVDFSKTLLLFYSERPFKDPLHWASKSAMTLRRFLPYEKYRPFLLCAGLKTKTDFNSLGLFCKRCISFGYFPEGNLKMDFGRKVLFSSGEAKILWAGRMVEWKHPQDVFLACDLLWRQGCKFSLDVVGSGPEQKRFSFIAASKPYARKITVFGNMRNDVLLRKMSESDLYLFTSGRKEGWGAVLNEAMSSACCVIASAKAGSTKSLIDNGVNGLVYQNRTGLAERVFWAFNHPTDASIMAQNGRKTIEDKWNGVNAATNLLQLIPFLQNCDPIPDSLINNGPGTLLN